MDCVDHKILRMKEPIIRLIVEHTYEKIPSYMRKNSLETIM